jgi:hypothetical protein
LFKNGEETNEDPTIPIEEKKPWVSEDNALICSYTLYLFLFQKFFKKNIKVKI